MIYKTTKLQWPELHKKIKAFVKKLDKYEISYKFNILSTSPERVTIYEVDPADRTTRYEAGFKIVDVVTYEFECETLKLGDWTPCAIINHQKAIGTDNKPMNEVHSVNGYAILDDWYYIDSKCEHCHTNRFRSTTVMLVDNKGNYKQVGSTCVKDFTGIDAFDIVRSFKRGNEDYKPLYRKVKRKMKDIVLMRNGEEVKCYRIRKAFMVNGFRVLVDDYLYGKKDSVIVDDDGKSDRVFETEEAAVKRVLAHASKLMSIKYIDSYIVREI